MKKKYLLIGGPYNLQIIGRIEEDLQEFRPPVPGYEGRYVNNGVISDYGVPQLDWEEDAVVPVEAARISSEELSALRQGHVPLDQFDGPVAKERSDHGPVVGSEDTGNKRG